MKTKYCNECGKTKSRTEFHKRKASKDGLQRICKDCENEYALEHRDEITTRKSAYRKKHKEQHLDSSLRYNYNISLAEYDDMLEDQGGGCAICGRTVAEEGRRLSVDHCHSTGRVRGLLCSSCNRGIGFLQDSPIILRNAIHYLEENEK